MELAHANIYPHIARAGIEERIARQTEPGDIIMRRQVLIGDADIDVADIDDVADVLRGAVEVFLQHDGFLPCRNISAKSGPVKLPVSSPRWGRRHLLRVSASHAPPPIRQRP